MSKTQKTRQPSISKLGSQIVQLRTIAKVAQRKDLQETYRELAVRVAALTIEYEEVCEEIEPHVSLMLNVELED